MSYWAHLSYDLSKHPKARSGSAGELLFPDHVGGFNAVQSSRSGSERLDPAHVPDATLDEPMILFDHVVQIFELDCLDYGWVAKPIKDFVNFSDARRVGTALVDNNLTWEPI